MKKIRKTRVGTKRGTSDWLWCMHCESFFQASHLRPDEVGGKEGCPFCDGAGIGVDIFPWNDWYKQNPDGLEHWPKSTEELEHGMKCSLYPE